MLVASFICLPCAPGAGQSAASLRGCVPYCRAETRAGGRGNLVRPRVRVEGPLIFNTTPPQIDAALAGLGLTLLPEDELSPHLQDGSLVRVLQDWCPPFDGYHLYYPSRRQPSPAFSLVVEALRWREAARS